jgi:diguanylate cyclase (GGDEF)-like protein/PAS domain S-box-containing protein
MLSGYRSNDAVITVCQNNRAKSIEISAVNKPAEEMLGYSSKELSGKALHALVPPRIGEMLSEYVEFETDANDVGQVLSKVQSFAIIGRDGKETGYKLKVVRSESTADTIHFQLVLQDKTGLRKNEALRKAIQDNFKGHEALDKETGLPDRPSLNKDIELMGYYNNKSDLRSCFAIMQLDHYDDLCSQYGRPACTAIMKHIAQISRQSLRPDDVVGSVAPKRIGVLLLDTTPDAARIVFNRLRWQIAANPYLLPDKTSVGLSVSISFSRVGGRIADRNILEECDRVLTEAGPGIVNALVEVEESSRRKSEA